MEILWNIFPWISTTQTRYFTTSSDGSVILPNNHISRYDNANGWLNRMKQGTQNTDPGFLNVEHEDYSSASFYRVTVTGGENQIYVKGGGNPEKGDDDKIIYPGKL